jgi:hypothetical protein
MQFLRSGDQAIPASRPKGSRCMLASGKFPHSGSRDAINAPHENAEFAPLVSAKIARDSINDSLKTLK